MAENSAIGRKNTCFITIAKRHVVFQKLLQTSYAPKYCLAICSSNRSV